MAALPVALFLSLSLNHRQFYAHRSNPNPNPDLIGEVFPKGVEPQSRDGEHR